MKNFTPLIYGILFSIVVTSCVTDKTEVDRTTPEKAIISLIDAINSNNIEIIDSTVNRNTDFFQFNNEISRLRIDTIEILNADSLESLLRIKLSLTDSVKREKIYDKLFVLTRQKQIWNIQNIKDFSFGSPTQISESEALSLVYGQPKNGETGNYDTIFREPVLSHIVGYNYILISTSQNAGEFDPFSEQTANAAILRWNGLRWAPIKIAENIMTSIDSNHGGLYIETAYLLKDNTLFFLLRDYQEGEFSVSSSYYFLNQDLKVFHEFFHERDWSPPFVGGDGSIEDKPINLPDSYKFYTYEYGFQDATLGNVKVRQRVRFNENRQPIHMEYWYKDRDEIMAEGGVMPDPSDSQRVLFNGYWYNKSTNFKGVYNNGRLVNNNVDILNLFKVERNIEKCENCKFGVIVNGYCDMCNVPSRSTLSSLNRSVNANNSKLNTLSCANKAMHNTLRYPQECPYCGYIGMIK